MKHWTRQAIASLHAIHNDDALNSLEEAYKIDPFLLPHFQDKIKVLDLDKATRTFLEDNPPTGTTTGSRHQF